MGFPWKLSTNGGFSTSFHLFLYIFVCLPEGIVLYQFTMSLHGKIQNLPPIFSSSARARSPVHLRIESVFCVTRNMFTAAGRWETNQKQAHDLFFVMTHGIYSELRCFKDVQSFLALKKEEVNIWAESTSTRSVLGCQKPRFHVISCHTMW